MFVSAIMAMTTCFKSNAVNSGVHFRRSNNGCNLIWEQSIFSKINYFTAKAFGLC